MLVIGAPQSGKTYAMPQFLSANVNCGLAMIESKFQNGPFLFHECTPISIEAHATKNFKYLTELNECKPEFTYKDGTIDVVIMDQSHSRKEKNRYINYRLLFDGYFRQFLRSANYKKISFHKLPKDIGNLIESFYEKPLILSYKIPIRSTVFDFWELSVFHRKEWLWCYAKAVCVIFVIDLPCFDETNPETKRNKMNESIKLFIETVSELQPNHGQSIILILNRKNECLKKLQKGHNLCVCNEFKFIQQSKTDFESVVAEIANTLRNTAKQFKSSAKIFTHIVSDMNGNEMQTISTDFVLCVISYTLAKGGIVH